MKDVDESILQINEFELDKECVRLPSQYGQAAFAAAETSRDIDELKAEMKVITAEMDLKIRANPERFGLAKITESAVDNLIFLNPRVAEFNKKLRALEHKAAMQDALVKALGIKRASLSNLVELHSAGYHSQVRPSSGGRETIKKISVDRVSRPIGWKGTKNRDMED